MKKKIQTWLKPQNIRSCWGTTKWLATCQSSTTWCQELCHVQMGLLKCLKKSCLGPGPQWTKCPWFPKQYNFTVITCDNITVIMNFPLISDWIGLGGSLWLGWYHQCHSDESLVVAGTMQAQWETSAPYEHVPPGRSTAKPRAFSNGTWAISFTTFHLIALLVASFCLNFASQR